MAIRTVKQPPATREDLPDGAFVRFEIFLFCAIGTVLVTRGLLAATGYPKVGSGELHIAHVLWGGLLLGVAVVMLLVGMGTQVRTWAALVAGIGFGLFIDEVGKFLTKDVNYFYTPAVAIMYVIFVGAFLIVRWLVRRRPLSDARRVAVAGSAVTDQALGELDHAHRAAILVLLAGVERPTAGAELISRALSSTDIASGSMRRRVNRMIAHISRIGGHLADNQVVWVILWILTAVGAGDRLYTYFDYLHVVIGLENLASAIGEVGGSATEGLSFGFYFWYLLVANLLCAVAVAVSLVMVLVRRLRRAGLLVLQWGLLLDLLFNQFSTFKTDQFQALIGFAIEVVVLLIVRRLGRRLTGTAG